MAAWYPKYCATTWKKGAFYRFSKEKLMPLSRFVGLKQDETSHFFGCATADVV
jgi:hypothetical protein